MLAMEQGYPIFQPQQCSRIPGSDELALKIVKASNPPGFQLFVSVFFCRAVMANLRSALRLFLGDLPKP